MFGAEVTMAKVRTVRGFLRRLVQYDALKRRRRFLALYFLIGVGAIFGLGYLGVDSSVAQQWWFFILVRLVIGIIIASLVLPVVWFLRRKYGLPPLPAGILFLVLTATLTILVLIALYFASVEPAPVPAPRSPLSLTPT